MTVSSEARSLLDSILGYARDEHNVAAPEDRAPRIATVDVDFDPTVVTAARVTFDGESVKTVRGYPWLGEPPEPGDRVVLIPVGRSYVIAGPIGQLVPEPPIVPVSVLPFRVAADTALLIASGTTIENAANDKTTVTFPAGRFTRAPIITGLTPTSARLTLAYESVTATGFVISADNRSGGAAGGPIYADWSAMQMTSASSGG